MTLQTERFYPNYSTGRPWADTAARHAWTGILAAGCTTTALTAALSAVGTITALGSDLPTQLVWTPVLATATIHLTRHTAWLARAIRSRA